MGFDTKGNYVHCVSNSPRFSRIGGSNHAEMKLMKHYGNKIKSIIIVRTNASGILRPIHPCKTCKYIAHRLGITIKSIES